MAEIVLRVAMKAVVVKDGKVLLLREAPTYGDGTNHGRYHSPGGRVEAGEHFAEALQREVREETGLEVEILHPIYVGEWRPVIRGVPHQIIGTFFVCAPKSDEIVLSTEHDDFQWVSSKEEAAKLDVMSPEDEVLEAYFKSLER